MDPKRIVLNVAFIGDAKNIKVEYREDGLLDFIGKACKIKLTSGEMTGTRNGPAVLIRTNLNIYDSLYYNKDMHEDKYYTNDIIGSLQFHSSVTNTDDVVYRCYNNTWQYISGFRRDFNLIITDYFCDDLKDGIYEGFLVFEVERV